MGNTASVALGRGQDISGGKFFGAQTPRVAAKIASKIASKIVSLLQPRLDRGDVRGCVRGSFVAFFLL